VLELDHLIVFRPGPDLPDTAGLVLDGGTRHVGQGTRNRRIVFADSYIELLWVESAVEAEASGLRFAERCAGAAVPFGVVARGRLGDRAGFTPYAVPDGPVLQVVDDPDAPFLAVNETDEPDRLRPVNRMGPRHVNPATGIERVELTCPVVPPVEVAGVSFVPGPAQLRVGLRGRAPLRFGGAGPIG
jgi:glyoxalase-like protein